MVMWQTPLTPERVTRLIQAIAAQRGDGAGNTSAQMLERIYGRHSARPGFADPGTRIFRRRVAAF